MGQQQLLLLVLGIVIVGLAVVVGIQAFGENQKKANADAMVNDIVRIASDAQAWNLKPKAFGGGAGSFTGLELPKLGYALAASGKYENLNASATNGGTNSGYSMVVTAGTPGSVVITGCNAATGNRVAATVSGTKPENITTVQSNVTTCS